MYYVYTFLALLIILLLVAITTNALKLKGYLKAETEIKHQKKEQEEKQKESSLTDSKYYYLTDKDFKGVLSPEDIRHLRLIAYHYTLTRPIDAHPDTVKLAVLLEVLSGK